MISPLGTICPLNSQPKRRKHLNSSADSERHSNAHIIHHRRDEGSAACCNKTMGQIRTRAGGRTSVREHVDEICHNCRLCRDCSPAGYESRNSRHCDWDCDWDKIRTLNSPSEEENRYEIVISEPNQSNSFVHRKAWQRLKVVRDPVARPASREYWCLWNCGQASTLVSSSIGRDTQTR